MPGFESLLRNISVAPGNFPHFNRLEEAHETARRIMDILAVERITITYSPPNVIDGLVGGNFTEFSYGSLDLEEFIENDKMAAAVFRFETRYGDLAEQVWRSFAGDSDDPEAVCEIVFLSAAAFFVHDIIDFPSPRIDGSRPIMPIIPNADSAHGRLDLIRALETTYGKLPED